VAEKATEQEAERKASTAVAARRTVAFVRACRSDLGCVEGVSTRRSLRVRAKNPAREFSRLVSYLSIMIFAILYAKSMMHFGHKPGSCVPSHGARGPKNSPPCREGSAPRRTVGCHPRWRPVRVAGGRRATGVVLSSEAARCPLTQCTSTKDWTNSLRFFPGRQVGQLSDLMSFFPPDRYAVGFSAKTRGNETTTVIFGKKWRVMLTLRMLPRLLAGTKTRDTDSANYTRIKAEQICLHSSSLLLLANILKSL